MPDVVISHLNALLQKIRKHSELAFTLYGLVIPDEIPHQDVEDTHFTPLPTDTQPTIADNSFYPTEELDSFNHGSRVLL